MNKVDKMIAQVRHASGADARPEVVMIIHRESGTWEMQVPAWIGCGTVPKDVSCSFPTLDEAVSEAQNVIDRYGGSPTVIVDNMIDQED